MSNNKKNSKEVSSLITQNLIKSKREYDANESIHNHYRRLKPGSFTWVRF